MKTSTVVEWHLQEAKKYEEYAKREHSKPATIQQFQTKANFHREAAICIDEQAK